MQKQGNGKQKSKHLKLTLLDLGRISFQSSDERVRSVEEASDTEFDTFIRQYVDVGWSLEERRDILNFAIESGRIEIPGFELETEKKNQSDNQEKIKDDVISDADEMAQEDVPQGIA